MKRFGLIGASGYIAKRHVEAIKNTGNTLTAMLDPHDNVGYIDSYFPHASYYKNPEIFERNIDRCKRKGNPLDFISICSPNFLHDSHIRLSLRNGCNAICEKPIVLKYDHLESLLEIEKETNSKVYTILQLRLHEKIKELKNSLNKDKHYNIKLEYITPRGRWYDYSWKGDINKSGGVTTNIGIHFFDMLMFVFGKLVSYSNIVNSKTNSKGVLHLENATVEYFLSIDKKDLPWSQWKPYRSISIDGEELEFSTGFTDLHTKSYIEILNGNGFTLKDALPSIQLVEELRFL